MNVKDLSEIISSRLESQASNLMAQWENPEGTKTRHFVLEDLLPSDVANSVYEAFPQGAEFWMKRKSFREKKKTFAKLEKTHELIAHITDAFHQPKVLSVIEKVTGLQMLEADPQLYAGGISMMTKGDFLNPHIDNSHDARRDRYRRLNLLYYISPDWSSECGGNLELWNDDVTEPKEIISRFNRLVVMETNKRSWHSVNPVLGDTARCCVSNYYFSKLSPDQKSYYHVTSFLGRPNQSARRFLGRIDNMIRQVVATSVGHSRGKKQARYM